MAATVVTQDGFAHKGDTVIYADNAQRPQSSTWLTARPSVWIHSSRKE